MFELYDFKFSHFSEKARWALDFKGVPYTPHHLLPGFHLRTTRKLAPRSSVPILKTDDAVIQGSTQIIDYLDQTFPDRSLTPPDPQDAYASGCNSNSCKDNKNRAIAHNASVLCHGF